mmetsp:Transcript_22036/g.56077  ORF Transcript_22036/g.56077 Transcript_22036/m.56077 type:complete len:288 (+) Transcript_22036:115-978(+)
MHAIVIIRMPIAALPPGCTHVCINQSINHEVPSALPMQGELCYSCDCCCVSSPLHLQVHQQGTDVCGVHATNAGRLANVPWPHLVQLLPGLHAERRDGKVVNVIRQLALRLGRQLLQLLLLARNEARVLDVNLHCLLLRAVHALTAQAVAVQQVVVDMGAAQQLLQRGCAQHRLPTQLAGLHRCRCSLGQPDACQALALLRDASLLLREHVPARIIHQPDLAPQRREPRVRVVRPQQQPVLGARGEHAVRLAQVLGHQVVHQGAQVGGVATKAHRLLVLRAARGVDA